MIMKVYVVIQNLEDWGADPKVFSTMEKAQAYIKGLIADEVICRMNEGEGHKTIGELFYSVEYIEGTGDINYVQYDKAGKDYISLDEREVE
jgi:hypothetical protein